MSKFFFVMQHQPTAEQMTAAAAVGEVVQLTDKKLLNVPDDPTLGKEFFAGRAEEIETALGGFGSGDTVHAMGQAQLAAAITARARKAGAVLVESVTPRISNDVPQADGTIKKELVFSFSGFRTVHEY